MARTVLTNDLSGHHTDLAYSPGGKLWTGSSAVHARGYRWVLVTVAGPSPVSRPPRSPTAALALRSSCTPRHRCERRRKEMTWQPEKPTLQFGKPLNHRQERERAFIAEWCCLAEGRADPEQTADAAASFTRQTARAIRWRSRARSGARRGEARTLGRPTGCEGLPAQWLQSQRVMIAPADVMSFSRSL